MAWSKKKKPDVAGIKHNTLHIMLKGDHEIIFGKDDFSSFKSDRGYPDSITTVNGPKGAEDIIVFIAKTDDILYIWQDVRV